MAKAAELLRHARRRAGVSQRALAIRAGTKQATISRLEAGAEEPTLERLERLLLVLGFRLDPQLAPLELPCDPEELAAGLRLTAEERLREAASWNKFATALELAGREE